MKILLPSISQISPFLASAPMSCELRPLCFSSTQKHNKSSRHYFLLPVWPFSNTFCKQLPEGTFESTMGALSGVPGAFRSTSNALSVAGRFLLVWLLPTSLASFPSLPHTHFAEPLRFSLIAKVYTSAPWHMLLHWAETHSNHFF